MWRIVEARKIKKLTADIIIAEEYQNWLSCHAVTLSPFSLEMTLFNLSFADSCVTTVFVSPTASWLTKVLIIMDQSLLMPNGRI